MMRRRRGRKNIRKRRQGIRRRGGESRGGKTKRQRSAERDRRRAVIP